MFSLMPAWPAALLWHLAPLASVGLEPWHTFCTWRLPMVSLRGPVLFQMFAPIYFQMPIPALSRPQLWLGWASAGASLDDRSRLKVLARPGIVTVDDADIFTCKPTRNDVMPCTMMKV